MTHRYQQNVRADSRLLEISVWTLPAQQFPDLQRGCQSHKHGAACFNKARQSCIYGICLGLFVPLKASGIKKKAIQQCLCACAHILLLLLALVLLYYQTDVDQAMTYTMALKCHC